MRNVAEQQGPNSRRTRTDLLLILLMALVYCFGLARLHLDWYFEDDPVHLYYVIKHPDLWRYFADRQYILDFSFGRTLTPMLSFGFWLDYQLGPKSPLWAYCHTALIVLLTSCFMYFLLREYLSRVATMLACGLWPLLPSSQSVIEFLAARHYLEGLTLVLGALLLTRRAVRSGTLTCFLLMLGGSFLYFLAMLCKEIHVTTGFWLLASMLVFYKRWFLLIYPLVTGLAYGVYRLAMVQFGEGYGSLAKMLESYPTFLGRLPFMFAGHWLGYLACLLLLMILIWGILAKWVKPIHLFFFFSNLAILLVTILPVSIHVSSSFQELGSWYRVLFLLNWFVLLCLVWLLDKMPPGPWRGMTLGLGLVALVLGSRFCLQKWDSRKLRYQEEAFWYLENGDRLLYSQLPATWFVGGVHRVFSAESALHFLTWNMKPDQVEERMEGFQTVWVFDGVGYRSDPALFQTMRQNYQENLSPLDKPRPAIHSP